MRGQRGFSYPIAMFLVAVLGLISARALENILIQEKRSREAELLSVGKAYRDAIRRYYEGSPGTVKKYPENLTLLLLDPRPTRPSRPLRKLFRDPITGSTDWGLITTETGAIKGVYSRSGLKPVKADGFAAEFSHFKDAQRYSDWVFVYEGVQ